MNPYLILAGLLAIGGAYVGGRFDGQAIEKGGQLRAERAADKQRQEDQGKIDASATTAQTAEVQRAADVRTIYREKETIVDRPIYRNVCVDADGVRLLDNAAAVANGLGFTPPARTTAASAQPATDGRGSDGGQTVPGVGP